jgi:hypothetical protein
MPAALTLQARLPKSTNKKAAPPFRERVAFLARRSWSASFLGNKKRRHRGTRLTTEVSTCSFHRPDTSPRRIASFETSLRDMISNNGMMSKSDTIWIVGMREYERWVNTDESRAVESFSRSHQMPAAMLPRLAEQTRAMLPKVVSME